MKNFKDKNLYENEIGYFEKFMEEKLVTKSEYNKYDTGEEEEEIDDFFSGVIGFGDDGGLDGISSGNDFDFGGGFGDSMFGNDFGAGQKNYDDWKDDNKINSFLASPLYLSRYVFDDLTEDTTKEENEKTTKFNLKLEHAKDFFKYVNFSGIFLFGTSVLSLLTGFNTLHHPYFGLGVGAACLLGGDFFNWKYFNQGILAKYKPNENPLINSEGESSIENNSDDGFGDFGMSEDNSSDPFGGMDFGMGEENSFDFGEDDSEERTTINLFDDEEEDEGYTEDLDFDEDDHDDTILKDSKVDVSNDKIYQKGLIKEFEKNEIYEGERFRSRKDVLDSFSGLLLNNDKSFSKWRVEREKSTVYSNIAYTIYKALIDINKQFGTDEKAKMTILKVESSPLLFKIQMKLPQTHFNESKLTRGIGNLNNHLKRDSADTEVQCSVSVSGDLYTIRLMRLDYKGLISIGDILRYKDDSSKTAYQQMIDPKKFTPMLVGLRDNEYPHVIDLQANTAMAIVGGSGSGKSWLTYELGMNLVTTSDYNEVNFLVLDYKNAMFWQSFARMPHVIGYHAPNPTGGYLDEDFLNDALKISKEVVEECQRRQSYLTGELGVEDIKEAHSMFKDNGEHDRIKEIPMLIFIIDEITSTMNKFEELGKDEYEAFRNNLNVISQVGRSAGVRLLTVGQRSIDKSLPKNVRMNTTLRFGMKQGNSDMELLFDNDKEVINMPKPTGIGQGIVGSEDHLGFHFIKTLTPGGAGNSQIRMLLRTVAFDWLRRARGIDDLFAPPLNANFKVGYNRPKFLDLSYGELKEGYLLTDKLQHPEVAIDLLSEKKAPLITQNLLSEKDKEVINNNVDNYISKGIDLSKESMDLDYEDDYYEQDIQEYDTVEDTDLETDFIEIKNNDFISDFENIDMDSFVDNIKINEDVNVVEEQENIVIDNLEDAVYSNIEEKIKKPDEHNEEEIVIEKDFSLDFDSMDFDLDSSDTGVDTEVDTEVDTKVDIEVNTEVDTEEQNLFSEEIDLFDILNGTDNNNEENKEYEVDIKESQEYKDFERERLEFEREKLLLEKERLKMLQEAEKQQQKLEQDKKEKQKQLEIELLELEKEKQELKRITKESEEKKSNIKEKKASKEATKTEVKKTADKIEITQFILLNGTSQSDFEKIISKEALLKVYTKAEINKAIRIGDILEYGDSYMVQI